MTSKEVLTELINMGVVHVLGDEYFITHRINKIFDEKETNTINLSEPERPTNINLYPKLIREASLGKKVETILNHCEVPDIVFRGEARFMVRSVDTLTKNSVIKIMKNPKYKPDILLKMIKDYYAYMEFPKAFKRFVGDGDIFSMYNYYEEGNSLANPNKPSNEICL